jgi:hypothetical protein
MPLTDVELIPMTEVKFFRPIFITLTPSIPVPVIVTTVPTGPEMGEIPVIVGPIVDCALQPLATTTTICVGGFGASTGAGASGSGTK